VRKALVPVVLVLLCSAALAHTPGEETYEAKWSLDVLDGPPVLAESTHDYDARFYRIDLDLPMTSGAMTARCGIWLKSEVPALDSAVFDFRSLECDSVKHADSTLDFYESYLSLAVYFDVPVPEDESIYVEIYYHRSSGTSNRGFYWYQRDPGRDRLHTVCYTLAQPENGRYWFPCFDHPWDKAEQGCQVNITVPDSFQACANGMLDSTTTNTDGTKTYWWTHRYPISSYLVNFGASVFSVWQQWCEPAPGESMPIINYVWPEDSVASLTSFQNVPDMVEFYSEPDRFGTYPFIEEKYGHVAVYPFGAGGMEHQTMTTVHRQWVTRGSESGIAHELGHMWFGDFLTCFIWAEIWINEGGASYLDPLWMYHFYGRNYFIEDMENYADGFFDADQRDRHPIYDPGLSRLFDWGHTYCKAAWVNHMTRYVEADTVFDSPGIWWETERAFLDSFAFGTATTEDRKRIHEDITGLELDWFYDEWVYQAGFPYYSVNWFTRQTTDGWELVVDIGQNNGQQAPDCFHMPVEILANMNSGDTLLHWDIESNPQRNVFEMPEEVTGIVFDPGTWLLHKRSITSGIENELRPEVGVSRPVLHAPSPNPATDRAVLRFALPHAEDVDLSVFDVNGRLVRTLASGRHPAGVHAATWTANAIPAGIYLVRLRAGDRTEVRKLVLE